MEPPPVVDGPRSEGQRLLVAIPGSSADIGRKVGVTKQVVACWRRGSKMPSDAVRSKLEAVYRIPVAAWDRAPGVGAEPPPPQAAPSSSPTGHARGLLAGAAEVLRAAGRMDLAAAVDAAAPARRLDREIAYLEELAHDPELAPTVRVRYQVELDKLLVEAERRDERERERAESLVTDPRVARILTAVLEAIAPHREAFDAAEAALAKLRAEEAA